MLMQMVFKHYRAWELGKVLNGRLSPVFFCKAFFEAVEVERVDIPATSGDMGVVTQHVPTIQQLRPGIIDVITPDTKSKKIFGEASRTVGLPRMRAFL
jgi:hypothetical protein